MFIAFGGNTQAGIERIAHRRALEASRARFGLPAKDHEPTQLSSENLLLFVRRYGAPSLRAYLNSLIRWRQGPEVIIARVAAWHGLSSDDILSSGRSSAIVEARFDAIVAVKKAFPLKSLPELGRIFGRDHTSILNALRKRGIA